MAKKKTKKNYIKIVEAIFIVLAAISAIIKLFNPKKIAKAKKKP